MSCHRSDAKRDARPSIEHITAVICPCPARACYLSRGVAWWQRGPLAALRTEGRATAVSSAAALRVDRASLVGSSSVRIWRHSVAWVDRDRYVLLEDCRAVLVLLATWPGGEGAKLRR